MVKLDQLPPPVLLHLIRFFESKQEDLQTKIRDFEVRDRNAAPVTDELVALATSNSTLRRHLRPSLFRKLIIHEDKVTNSYAAKIKLLVERSPAVLACVRHLIVGSLLPEGIKQLDCCLKIMTSLECLEWCGRVPLAPLLVQTLNTLPTFRRLEIKLFGTESLPYILPLADKVDHLEIDCDLHYPYPPQSVILAPITVAVERRKRLPWDDKNVPTVHEQRAALVKGLSTFLLQAKDHLEYLDIKADDLSIETSLPGTRVSPVFYSNKEVTRYESGQWLQRLFDAMVDDDRSYPTFQSLKRLCIRGGDLKCLALKHLLKSTANHLTHLEIVSADHKELPAPPLPLSKLEYFYYLLDDDVSCVPITRHITTHSPLRMLTINGMIPSEVGRIFGPLCACSSTLTRLHLIGFAGGALKVTHVEDVVRNGPELEELTLRSVWGGEAIDFLAAFEPLKKLRKFTFDHPWEKPRSSPWPEPDGRTIRRERDGDFRVISVIGKTIGQEMRDRVLADMKAVKATYAKRFGSFAHKHPQLETISWGCTDKVNWLWFFSRKPDPGTRYGYKLVYRQVADIEYGKDDDDDEVVPGAVLMTMPRS